VVTFAEIDVIAPVPVEAVVVAAMPDVDELIIAGEPP
jgi:hypothetical protein